MPGKVNYIKEKEKKNLEEVLQGGLSAIISVRNT